MPTGPAGAHPAGARAVRHTVKTAPDEGNPGTWCRPEVGSRARRRERRPPRRVGGPEVRLGPRGTFGV